MIDLEKPRTGAGAINMTVQATQADMPVDQKTDAIVKAARKTFLARGFDAASMDQIALEAAVSKRTVYNRFRSKEELFGAAIEDTCRKILPVDVDEIDFGLPPGELLMQLSLQFVKGVLDPEALSLRRIAAFEAERTPAIGQSYLAHGPQWMVDKYSPILVRMVEKGVLKIDDPEAAIWQLGALVTEPLYTCMLLGAPPEDLDAAIAKQVTGGVTAFLKLYAEE
jgi:TetR/AcrR family transcriptional repressor of mexJK operon